MSASYKVIIAVTGTLSTLVMFGLAHLGRHSERRHLFNKGKRVQGTVISMGKEGESTKSAPVLRYQFTPHGQAQVVEGRCTVNVLAPYKPGDSVVVCYNAAHPFSSIVLSPSGDPL